MPVPYRPPGAPVQYRQPPYQPPKKAPVKYNPAAGYKQYRPSTGSYQPPQSLTPGAPGPTPYDLPAYVPGGGSARSGRGAYDPNTGLWGDEYKVWVNPTTAPARPFGGAPPQYQKYMPTPAMPGAGASQADWVNYALNHPPSAAKGSIATPYATGWGPIGQQEAEMMYREGIMPYLSEAVSGYEADRFLRMLGIYDYGVNPYNRPQRPAAPAPALAGGGGGGGGYPAYPSGGGGRGGNYAQPYQRQQGRYPSTPNVPRWMQDLTSWTIRG